MARRDRSFILRLSDEERAILDRIDLHYGNNGVASAIRAMMAETIRRIDAPAPNPRRKAKSARNPE